MMNIIEIFESESEVSKINWLILNNMINREDLDEKSKEVLVKLQPYILFFNLNYIKLLKPEYVRKIDTEFNTDNYKYEYVVTIPISKEACELIEKCINKITTDKYIKILEDTFSIKEGYKRLDKENEILIFDRWTDSIEYNIQIVTKRIAMYKESLEKYLKR